MKTRIGLIIVLLAVLISLAGCTTSSPSSVVKNFYKYVQNEQYDKAVNLFSQAAIDQYGITKLSSIVQAQKQALDYQGGIQEFEVTKEQIVKDYAAVYIKITTGDGQVQEGAVNLIKEDKEWRIDLGK